MSAAFADIWKGCDAQVTSGRVPGYVGAVRIRGVAEEHAGGRMALDPGASPMTPDTLFRVASVTKLFAGALAMSLVQDGSIALDDPIGRWLPEAATPRVLVTPDADLEDTVDAERSITIRHLLTMTSGWGCVLQASPLQAAMFERKVFPGPLIPPMSGDEFVARLAALPLAFQPGEGWLYDTGVDVFGVLASRATGHPVSRLVADRITGPLGLTSTSFGTREIERLATAYRPGPDGLEVLDPPEGEYSRPPTFEELSSGLVSTAGDVLRFMCAMADGGAPILKSESVALMTSDALDDEQRRQALPIVGPGGSWGIATGVDHEVIEPWQGAGRWGWNGGTGTTAYVDPSRDTVAVLMTQRAVTAALDAPSDFWAAVARAAG